MTAEHPERTPAAWAKACLTLLQESNPDYHRNREVSGRFIEFIRRDSTGLLVSQNFVRVRSTYSLCFGLSFTPRFNTRLYYPLYAGSRFDHVRSIWRQFDEDLKLSRGDPGYPSGLWSCGPWRSNTMENLARGFALNEQYLFPFYHQALAAGKQRLIALFEAAQRLIPAIDPTVPVVDQAAHLGIERRLLESYPLPSANLNALTVALGGKCYVGFGPKGNTIDVDTISPEIMVLHFAEEFLQERHRFDEILATAETL